METKEKQTTKCKKTQHKIQILTWNMNKKCYKMKRKYMYSSRRNT